MGAGEREEPLLGTGIPEERESKEEPGGGKAHLL